MRYMTKGLNIEKIFRGMVLSLGLMLVSLAAHASVTPANVDVQLAVVSEKISALAKYMGEGQEKCVHFSVSKVSPREVYFQALSLNKMIDELNSEVVGVPVKVDRIYNKKTSMLKPADVLGVLRGVNDKVDGILLYLKIKLNIEPRKPNSEITPSDVYMKLLKINKVVAGLLERKALSSDVYRMVTLSSYYAGDILVKVMRGNIGINERSVSDGIGSFAVFEKQVYILKRIQRMAKLMNIEMLDIERSSCDRRITSEDVQSLSTIILSEITHVAPMVGVDASDHIGLYVGKKYPRNVYERSDFLLNQVNAIIGSLENNSETTGVKK